MNLCSDSHDEICFDGRNCPACGMREAKDMIISRLETRIGNLESQIDELESQIVDGGMVDGETI